MSNFAERLAARSAGTPPGPGISVLATRPASRFEPATGIEVEQTVASDLAQPPVDRPIVQREIERASPTTGAERSMAREASTPIAQSERRGAEPKPHLRTAPLAQLQNEIEATPDHAIPHVPVSYDPAVNDRVLKEITQTADLAKNAASPQHVATEVLGLRLKAETQAGEPSPRALARKRAHEADRPSRGAGHAYASGEERSGEPPAPTISIGKIEVQFLPQEQRISMPRPQLERTRGFEAYARARRGEPR